MLAYAPRRDSNRLRPTTLGMIILGHAGMLALVMTARSGIITENPFRKTVVTLIPETKPPIEKPKPQAEAKPTKTVFTTIKPMVTPPDPRGPAVPDEPTQLPTLGSETGTGTGAGTIQPPLDPPLIRTGPRMATAGDAIRPPYPDAMRESGREASLRLRLSIDERGRVVAVEPVGRADPTFLAAARRHILRAWRYQPAMEGARAVPSTTTVTLKFELGSG